MVTKSAGRDSKELITRAAVRRLLILEVLAIERVPRFQEFDNMFRVELFRVNPITDQANQATNQANQDLERLDQVEDENVLSEKEIEILNLVRMQPSITQKEMANALDWNLASVKYYITKLKEKNYLKRQGSSQKGKWVILTKRD